ncbi:MAG: hypothetical protein KAS71_10965 [Bacteroidales bacterium]|nr:hypothetical protein [Bacteroidales bacterium]
MKNFRLILFVTFLSLSFNLVLGQAKSPNFIVFLTDDQSWVGTSCELMPEKKEELHQLPLEYMAKEYVETETFE